MNRRDSPTEPDAYAEVSALIETLRATERRIEELTSGEVDSVAERDGSTFLLRRAQDQIHSRERKSTQAALAQSEFGLHRAQLMAKLSHVITGPDGSFEQWSETFPQLIGVEPSELPRTTRAWLDIVHPDDRLLFRAKAIEAGSKELRVELEYRLRRADGEWIRVWQMMEPLEVEGDDPVGRRWFNTLQDVTAQRTAKESLHATKLLLHNILENMPTAVQLKSVQDDFRILMWNKAAESLYGMPRETAIGRTVHDLWPDADADRMHAADLDLVAKGGMQDFPDRPAQTKNRGEIRVHMRKVALVDASGKTTHLLVIADDISAQLADQESLRQSEERTRLIVESSLDAVVVMDAAGLITDWNTQAETTFGWSRKEVIGLPLAQTIVPAKHRHAHTRGLRASLETGVGPIAYKLIEITALHRDGHEFPVELAVSPFQVNGTWLFSYFIRDLSERKQAEHKIRRLNRVYAVLSGINTLIVRVRDRDELFREACRIAVEDGQFQLAWIGVVDRIAMKIVPVASAGVDTGFLDEVRERLSLRDAAPAGHGPAARAVREKRDVVVNDVAADPRIRHKGAHAKRGIRSLVSLPLVIANDSVAVLSLHATEAGYFDEAEMKLLRELAGDIAFAIDHIDKQERLDYLAYYDALTGLANRSLFLERVAQYMRGAVSGGHKLALFLLDVERFKNINDSLGQLAGDALLRQVAEWLTRNVVDANLLARIGADHFAVVLPVVKEEGNVAGLVERSMEAFLSHPFHLNDAVFRIAAKVGVALFPSDGADAETLFRNAEAALKKAKASGDRYLFYTQKMTALVAGRLTLENQLRQALGNEEFVLHYQPKMSLASGKLTGVEALIRWNDPRTGLVPPMRFIPILEETGLIHEVGHWALRKAIEDYLRWRVAGLTAVRVSVNVSSLQLRRRSFITEIEQVIGSDGHAAAGLELEITESLIMEDVKRSIVSLQAIRATGVMIAIDDFGTGFSSLSYLSKLPVDTLKIDRSFVSDMTATQEGLALVSTIINLAHSLKLNVVAEGVETEEQSRLLRLLNCDEAQGYLFSKPVPCEVFESNYLTPLPAG